ncbi:hypothetical protein HG537_0D02710 [Torulaspora globosa]|uniref:Actin patches distal protein 1 n=1 Tax=Torulaspora globosa TaxID=48254 RepID=A0A7H9HSC8_9SACH|nr:hypothetical protein HG537_0D02710 [Torulaspora sp. CBS 2947]
MVGIKALFGLKKDGIDPKATEDIAKVVEICDGASSCGSDCEEEMAELAKGDKVYEGLKIDHEEPLYNSSKPPKVHFVVPTSQMDWEHDACLEDTSSVQYHIYDWCQKHNDEFSGVGNGQKLSCAVSSLPKDIMDVEVMRGTKNNVLVLPHFIWINGLESGKVDQTLNELVPKLLSPELAIDKLVEEYSMLSRAIERSFVLVCSHTRRDKRCGIMAPYLKKAFDQHLQKQGLYRDNSDFRPNGVNVAFVNHVGGHKFAANVQIFLKDPCILIWLGRVKPTNVPFIVDGILVPEKPKLQWPEKVRCVQKYASW